MQTQPNITKTERVDDIPLLLAQMEKMQVAALIDKNFPTHGNWQGLSLGQIVTVWLSYILSEGDHRLNAVQRWAAGLLNTLKMCLNIIGLRELDFTDDRLCKVLDYLGENDDAWENYERDQNATLIRVYDLKPRRIRIDSTTAKSYVTVTDDGLFQFGHSKEHRPDLPQVKINQSVLDPLGIPLSTTIVSGECADDPLYVPEIRKVQASLNRHGLSYIGDSKMAALETRAYVAKSHDYYLCPLTEVQMPKEKIQELLIPVWTGAQQLTPIYRPIETTEETPEHIANGFSYTITLKTDDGFEWQEQNLVVQSLKYKEAQQKALDKRLKKSVSEIEDLNQVGRGRKRLNEAETRAAVDTILERHKVADLLRIEFKVKTETKHKRSYLGRPARHETTTTVTVNVVRDAAAYENAVRNLGWRVFVSNDLALTVPEVVLAYREQYIIERGFKRYRGKILGLTPLYLSSSTRIKGLIRLLCIGLRVLCSVEFTVREALREKNEKLSGIYAGNPKRATAKPTTELMLKVFEGITLTVVSLGEKIWYSVTALSAVQLRILDLLGFPTSIYQGLAGEFG